MSAAGAAVLYAVVVGWNGSPSPDVPALRFADDDAVEYARLFRDAGARTTLLTTLDADSRALHADARVDGPPTRDALLGALARIDAELAQGGAGAGAGDAELVIVYTGHGDVDHGEGFVMLDGARLTRSDLRDRVLGGRRAPPRRTHVIVDACKSYYLVYPRGGERRRHDAPFLDGKADAGLRRVGFLLSTSSDADSHEWEEVQGGVFSHEVRSGLRGAADADGDGVLSYAEVAAFVRTANLGIPNARFRPRFTVVPPPDSALAERTPLLGWSGGAASMAVRLDTPGIGRVSVEDALGRRLVDARFGGRTDEHQPTLHLPRTALYVWDRSGDREFALDGEHGAVLLSSLAPRPRRFASRGAQGDAFAQLFASPFGSSSVDEWLHAPREALADADADMGVPPRRLALYTTLGVGAAALLGGLALTTSAVVLHDENAAGSQQARAAANADLERRNAAAVGLYAVAGAAAVTSAILGWWPRAKHTGSNRSTQTADLVPSVAVGPGALSVTLSGRFDWR